MPPLGSFKFNLIAEGLRREKSEKVAFAKLMIALLAPISGMKRKEAQALLEEYAEEIYQFKYNYKYQPVRVREQNAADLARAEDKRLLSKVDAMTVKD